MAEITFRDFAGAVMQGNRTGAIGILEQLLDLDTDGASRATDHFTAQMKDAAFMPKAMSLRAAVTAGSDEDIGSLLGDCFGLAGEQRTAAVAALRKRYPPPRP